MLTNRTGSVVVADWGAAEKPGRKHREGPENRRVSDVSIAMLG